MHIGSKLKLSCACCVSCVCCAFARKRRPRVNQSIKGPHKATHGPKRSHISAPPQGGQPLHYKVMRVHFLLRRPGYGMPRLIQLINLMKCEERTDDGYMMTMKVVYIYKFCCWRVGGTRLCAGAPRGVVPPCGPPAVLCAPPPVVGACPVCCPPLRWALAPCAGAPPQGCVPDRDHCYDRREATALDASIRSLHGDARGAATHTPTGRVSGGLGRRTLSSTARSRRSASRAVVEQQQPVAAEATAPLPTSSKQVPCGYTKTVSRSCRLLRVCVRASARKLKDYKRIRRLPIVRTCFVSMRTFVLWICSD